MNLRQRLQQLTWPIGQRSTWRPKIRQRQWLSYQRLYGHRHGEPEPAEEIDVEDMPDVPGDV